MFYGHANKAQVLLLLLYYSLVCSRGFALVAVVCDFVHHEVQSLMFRLLLCVRTMKRIGAILTASFPEYGASTMSGLPPLRRIKV